MLAGQQKIAWGCGEAGAMPALSRNCIPLRRGARPTAPTCRKPFEEKVRAALGERPAPVLRQGFCFAARSMGISRPEASSRRRDRASSRHLEFHRRHRHRHARCVWRQQRRIQAHPYYAPRRVSVPITISRSDGKSLTLQQPPARLVSFSPGATEIIYAIGAGPSSRLSIRTPTTRRKRRTSRQSSMPTSRMSKRLPRSSPISSSSRGSWRPCRCTRPSADPRALERPQRREVAR